MHSHLNFQVCQTIPTSHKIILLPSIIAQNGNLLLTESCLSFFIVLCKTLKPILHSGATLPIFPHTLWIFPNDWRCITLHLQWIRQLLNNIPLKLKGVNQLAPADIKCLTSSCCWISSWISAGNGRILLSLEEANTSSSWFPNAEPRIPHGLKPECLSQPVLWVCHYTHSHDKYQTRKSWCS